MGALGDIPAKTLLDFDFGSYKGYIAENFVIQALKSYSYGSIYGWSEGKAEVEFIFSNVDGQVPIEVKSGKVTQAKSLAQFINKYAPTKAYIFGSTVPRKDKQGLNSQVLRRPIYSLGIGKIGKLQIGGLIPLSNTGVCKKSQVVKSL
jgi:hypothetical protein